MATIIGHRTTAYGTTETMYRLSRPLSDVAPDWRNVMVQVRDTGERHILRSWGYAKADGTWAASPQRSWIACFQPLSARDLAFAESEIAQTTAA